MENKIFSLVYTYMIDDIIVEKIIKNTAAGTIDKKIKYFSELVKKMKEVKRKTDLEGSEYNSKPTLESKDFNDASKYPRACKTRKKYNSPSGVYARQSLAYNGHSPLYASGYKADSDDEEDDDSSSDYVPDTDSDDEDSDEDSDE